jgi:hypothetical protein
MSNRPKYLSAIAGGAAALLAGGALAGERSTLELSSIRAATSCVARAALNNPRIVTFYLEHNLKQVTDWIILHSNACRDELIAIRKVQERIHGPGTGQRFLVGDYAKDLPSAVRARIADEIERRIAAAGSSTGNQRTRVANTCVVKDFSLNIRKSPSGKSRILGEIPVGDIVTCDFNKTVRNARGRRVVDWTFIRHGSMQGWVDKEHLSNPQNGPSILGKGDETDKSRPPGRRGDVEQDPNIFKALGLDLANLTDALRKQYNINDDIRGVIITGVDRISQAAEKKLEPGDVVTEFSREPIADVNAVRQRIEQLKTEGQKMVLLFVSPNKGDARLVGLELE